MVHSIFDHQHMAGESYINPNTGSKSMQNYGIVEPMHSVSVDTFIFKQHNFIQHQSEN